MKVKVIDIVNSSAALREMAGAKMPIQMALKIKRLISQSAEVIDEFEKRRVGKASEVGTLNEETNRFEFDAAGAAEFSTFIEKLGNSKIDIDGEKIKITELPADIEIEPNTLLMLEWLIDFEDKPKAPKKKARRKKK